MRTAYNNLIGELQGKILIGQARRTWQDSMKTFTKDTSFYGIETRAISL
jgi:hypothetical protein